MLCVVSSLPNKAFLYTIDTRKLDGESPPKKGRHPVVCSQKTSYIASMHELAENSARRIEATLVQSLNGKTKAWLLRCRQRGGPQA